jgi:hypothetical protein
MILCEVQGFIGYAFGAASVLLFNVSLDPPLLFADLRTSLLMIIPGLPFTSWNLKVGRFLTVRL